MTRLVAIEGIDGSGKGTQSKRLVTALQDAGHTAALISFPRYDHTAFGAEIGRFLNGVFGPLDQVHPFLAATLYAGDRYESRGVLVDAIDSHEFVVLDRYVASNLAHQGVRTPAKERMALWDRIEHLEFHVYNLPRPDLNILLDIPGPIARQLVAKKSARSYTEREADLQEENVDYLNSVRSVYQDLAASNSETWRIVPCMNADDSLRTLEDVAASIYEHVNALA